MTDDNRIIPFPQAKRTDCVSCGSQRISTRTEEESFPYGEGDAMVTLSAEVPVHSCSECGFRFTDETADKILHDVVCRHLGVMTPDEIQAVRKRLGLSRAEFARQTRIGEASINRWERGALIQNPAMDAYIYLLSLPENLPALQNRRDPKTAQTSAPTWQILAVTPEVKDRQVGFSL